VSEDPRKAKSEKRVPLHFKGSQIIRLLTPQVQVLDYCQVTRFSKMLEDSTQSLMHHLPVGTRLHRHISQGGGDRPGDGCPGFLSKMGVTLFIGTQVEWEGTRYVRPTTQIHLQKFAPCLVACTCIASVTALDVLMRPFISPHTHSNTPQTQDGILRHQ
jgi:hypothetical protein